MEPMSFALTSIGKKTKIINFNDEDDARLDQFSKVLHPFNEIEGYSIASTKHGEGM
jgi:hypothetical protein